MSIFNHICIGTNNPDKSLDFYDAALGTLDIKRLVDLDGRGGMYGVDAPQFMVTVPRNGETACHANGGTIAFKAASREAVNAFHAAGLANGGTCEGEPGERDYVPNAYGAYLRDPDGNKICAFTFVTA